MKQSMFALLLVLGAVSPSLYAGPKEDIVAIEKASWKAFEDHDAKAYGDTMTDDVTMVPAAGYVMRGKKAVLADLTNNPCEVKSYDLADVKVRQLTADSALLSYKLTQDVTCNGKKLSPTAFATSVYVREAGKWRSVSYQETAIK